MQVREDVLVMRPRTWSWREVRGKRFEKSAIRKVIGSDTYPGISGDDLVEVYSVAPLLADILKEQLLE